MELGTIIRIADPLFPVGSPHVVVISDVKPGEYQASTTKIDGRTAKIALTHINYIGVPYIQGSVEHYSVVIDTAQCMISDYYYYMRNKSKTLNDLNKCITVSTGYGDGVYECTVVRNAQGDAVNIYVTFIEEE